MCGIVGFTGNPENKEQIIRAMENDKLPLEQSLALYEEGVAIVRRLSAELDAQREGSRFCSRMHRVRSLHLILSPRTVTYKEGYL